VRRTQFISSLSVSSTVFSAASVISVVGLCVSLGGCEAQSKRARSTNNNEPVNTTLSKIGGDSGLALPEDEALMSRDDGFGSVHDQIQESARQLNVYFANMEIDGVEPVDLDSRTRVLSPTDQARADQATIDQAALERAAFEQAAIDQRSDQNSADQARAIDPVQTAIQSANEQASEKPLSSDGGSEDGGVRVSLLSGSSNVDESIGEVDDPGESTSVEPITQETADASQADGGLGQTQEDGSIDGMQIVDESLAEQDPAVRKEELARELASILANLTMTSDDPGSAALALASLETILPTDTGSLIDQGVLSDAEKASLDAAKSFLRSMSSEGSIASPAEVASQLEQIQNQLNAWVGLTIKKAALCTQVYGYGRYETFHSYRFVAGVEHRAIVYVELERFAQRELTGPDGQPRYETKVSQRLELYHVADDLNTWNRSVETVVDETRNHLRDYFLTNQIALPANLSVGRYHLKVVMRDLIGERSAETIIPIEIVAR
jgi:hypothetical protein